MTVPLDDGAMAVGPSARDLQERRPASSNGDGAAEAGLRCLAFYLPQFHPIPENDEWWGPGFTEWRNVVKARPQIPGHYQPHLPADLGYYDLRVPEVRSAQADLARTHGIDGFVYYHYWFGGKLLLERPFNEVLASGQPDFPFCLCWANENWTRVWDGGSSNVLIAQHYSEEDDRAHLQWLAPAFADHRYIRVGGRPMFLVYRASSMPNPRRTTDLWREEARSLGIGELYLCRVESFAEDRDPPGPLGFDASVEFQPDYLRIGPMLYQQFWRRAWRRLLRPNSPWRLNSFRDYDAIVELALDHPKVDYKRFRCVLPAWDNTPRRHGARIVMRSTPEKYGRWLTETIRLHECYGPDEDFIFVNAWNEWAEGNHLEPDEKWGRAYLEAHAAAIATASRRRS